MKKLIIIIIIIILFVLQNSLWANTNGIDTCICNKQSIYNITGLFEKYVEPEFPKSLVKWVRYSDSKNESSRVKIPTLAFAIYLELSEYKIVGSKIINPLYLVGNTIPPNSKIWKEAIKNIRKAIDQWKFNPKAIECIDFSNFWHLNKILIILTFDYHSGSIEFEMIKSINVKHNSD